MRSQAEAWERKIRETTRLRRHPIPLNHYGVPPSGLKAIEGLLFSAELRGAQPGNRDCRPGHPGRRRDDWQP